MDEKKEVSGGQRKKLKQFTRNSTSKTYIIVNEKVVMNCSPLRNHGWAIFLYCQERLSIPRIERAIYAIARILSKCVRAKARFKYTKLSNDVLDLRSPDSRQVLNTKL